MSAFSVHVGAAFLIPSGTQQNPSEKHMFVVCTDLDNNGVAVLASISSWKNNLCDGTCKLDPGCHPFVRKPSYVLYRKSRIEHGDILLRGLERAVFIPLDDVKPELLEQIKDGLLKSKQTPWQVKRYLKNN